LWETVAVAGTQQANGAELHFLSFGRERDGPVLSSPIANFTFSPPNPVAGQTVAFADLSLGGPTSWSWSFADGGSSTVENAVHNYLTGSTYDVTLTVDNAQGSSSVTRPLTVLPAGLRAPSIAFTVKGVSRDPVFDAFDALVGQPITFTASETAATQYVWDFGDGTSGSGQTIVKTYTAAGSMSGHLSVYGDGVHSQVGPLIGNFRINVKLPGLPLPSGGYTLSGAALDHATGNYDSALGNEITFSAVETNASQYLWYFGDGTAASGRVVTKAFLRGGLWTVKLVVYGDGTVTARGPTVIAIPVNVRVCKRCPRTVPFH
jgi:PKD repeat protein